MKETFYFSHDYHARTDEKVIELLLIEKWEGYWLFWAIVEKLYENEWYIDQNYERIAYDLRTNNERIRKVVENYWLFIFDGKRITSKSVLERLKQRKDKSKKAQQSVKARWDKEKNGNTNVIRNEYERNTIKERKGKENKVKETNNTTAVDFYEKELLRVTDQRLLISLREWWQYKKGKYKEDWWQKTITIALKYPPQSVCDRIDEAIASGWEGMNLSTIKIQPGNEKPVIHRLVANQ